MKTISVLDKNTIDKIAAGEVIERPASIVKELVENAIDAGANAVTVEIKDGGTSLVRITDNGEGIAPGEVKKAFLRHATSKITRVEDLLGISSLGFRGEALSSIAAVCQVELITKTAGELTGVRYIIEGGEEKTPVPEEIGAPEGTTFKVRNVFYNTPARRKFLKSPQTEAGYISDLMERMALSHPEVSFKFINNNQNKLHTSGNANLKDIIYGIFGRDITANLLEIQKEAPFGTLTGFIGKPTISRGNRNYENYFINGRYIRSNIISKAIEDAYKNFMMQHKYPFTALHFSINGDLLDVNVHPTKMELRFSNQEEIYKFVYETVREALSQREMIPNVHMDNRKPEIRKEPPKDASYPEPFEVKRREAMLRRENPALGKEASAGYAKNFERKPEVGAYGSSGSASAEYAKNSGQQPEVGAYGSHGSTSAGYAKSPGQQPEVGVYGSQGNVFAGYAKNPGQLPETGAYRNLENADAGYGKKTDAPLEGGAHGYPGSGGESEGGKIPVSKAPVVGPETGGMISTSQGAGQGEPPSGDLLRERSLYQAKPSHREEGGFQKSLCEIPEAVKNPVRRDTDEKALAEEWIAQGKNPALRLKPRENTKQLDLFEEKLLSKENVKEHKIIGQLFDTYWLVEFQEKLYIIDQHAAHEKVLFERTMKSLADKEYTAQQISPPIIISLSLKEQELLKKYEDNFKEIGFEIEHFGGDEFSIRAVPGNLFGLAEKDVFLEMLDGLANDTGRISNDLINEKIASMSCKAAVKGNHRMSEQEARALIDELLTLENPYNCPHGRPTIISMTKYELEKKFKRIV